MRPPTSKTSAPPQKKPATTTTTPSPGAEVLSAGDVVGVAEVGILATVGATRLPVFRAPLVGVLSTGDEVVDPEASPAPGQIRDCNRAMLLAAAAAAGAGTVDLGIARDGEGDVEGAFARALEAGVDVLITSGGVEGLGGLDWGSVARVGRGLVWGEKGAGPLLGGRKRPPWCGGAKPGEASALPQTSKVRNTR